MFDKKKPATDAAIDGIASKANVTSPAKEQELLKAEVPRPMTVMEKTEQPVPPQPTPPTKVNCIVCRKEFIRDKWAICSDQGGTFVTDYERKADLCESCANGFINGAFEKQMIGLPDLMLELEVIGEIFKKRKIYSVQSLKFENGRFTLTCSWMPEPGAEMRRFIGRSISSSLTPKGLAMVIGELKAGVGL